MRIKQIEIYKSPVQLKEPFIISLGPAYYAENIIVVIRTDTGINGYGECSPLSMINGETIDTGFIVGQYLAENLLGKEPLNIPECHSIMNRTIYGNSSIKSAFDIALYDVASQNAVVPLHSFLGENNRKKLVTDYTVCLSDPACMAENALKVKERGFRIIKIKLGETGMKIQMGGFLETRLGFTASAHLALACENVRFCDFDTPLMLTEDPVNGGINYKSGGIITVRNVPGLGATIKQEFLENLTKTVIC
jgi:L-alanine-DL-glutamate epimerase-like enolase superfamily enzyme